MAVGFVIALATLLAVATASGRLSPKHYPVLLAYALGLCIGASGLLSAPTSVAPAGDHAVLTQLMQACVALAIPALLLRSGVAQLRALGRRGALAGLCVWAGALAAAGVATWVLAKAPTETALTLAIFTGSLANLQAAGAALGTDATVLLAANLGDVVAGGLLFAALTSFGPGLLRRLLVRPGVRGLGVERTSADAPAESFAAPTWRHWLGAVAGAVAALAAGLAVDALAVDAGLPSEFVIIATASAVSVALASTVVTAGVAEAGSRIGEGLMIAFCVLVGTGADVTALAGEAVSWAIAMGAFVGVEIAVAVVLARALRLDADALLLALAGAIYSPAFVAPVAHAAGRRDAMAIGIAWGLIGLALGTPAALAFAAYFPAP